MAVIKTGDWLRRMMKAQNITQAQLADKAGVSRDMIAKILSGDRPGSGTIWDALEEALEVPDQFISYDSEENISECREAVQSLGGETPCWITYRLYGDSIIFLSFIIDNGDEPLSEDDLHEDEKYFTTTLGQALELFEHQDSVF